MIEVTFDQLQTWLAMFLWPFTRITAFFAASPLWGHSSVPNEAKVGLAALIAIVISPALPPLPPVPIMSWGGLGIIVEQIIIGVSIGMVMQFTFGIVQAAGAFIGLKMGLAFANFFDPGSGTNIAVLSRILFTIALIMFLALNGHLIVLEILATSFQTLPIGLGGFNPDAFELLARYSGVVFTSGMLLALPVVAPLVIVSIGLGILNRASPQLTVFSIGFPTSLIFGLVLLMVMMGHYGGFLERIFTHALSMQQRLLDTLAPL
ncbi:MAG: flagellar biosynthetic protein FliR [Chromatiaceae bacterium]|nr:flagellar biosynthetic protein FliR [Chromatiaceae bacterium]MCF7994587.1 flagellar biosynthetic protein FliR [Chromatiaceae bacterium]MCF8014096.1 flagellar biosynthetic protein FliR [Chromatiaceae bacterium]